MEILQKMLYLNGLLYKIKKRPGMFLKNGPSLEELRAFINGYMCCKMETDIYVDYYSEFQTFIEQKYDRKGSEHHVQIIQSVTVSDEEAFYKFFELLDEFLEQNQNEQKND